MSAMRLTTVQMQRLVRLGTCQDRQGETTSSSLPCSSARCLHIGKGVTTFENKSPLASSASGVLVSRLCGCLFRRDRPRIAQPSQPRDLIRHILRDTMQTEVRHPLNVGESQRTASIEIMMRSSKSERPPGWQPLRGRWRSGSCRSCSPQINCRPRQEPQRGSSSCPGGAAS